MGAAWSRSAERASRGGASIQVKNIAAKHLRSDLRTGYLLPPKLTADLLKEGLPPEARIPKSEVASLAKLIVRQKGAPPGVKLTSEVQKELREAVITKKKKKKMTIQSRLQVKEKVSELERLSSRQSQLEQTLLRSLRDASRLNPFLEVAHLLRRAASSAYDVTLLTDTRALRKMPHDLESRDGFPVVEMPTTLHSSYCFLIVFLHCIC